MYTINSKTSTERKSYAISEIVSMFIIRDKMEFYQEIKWNYNDYSINKKKENKGNMRNGTTNKETSDLNSTISISIITIYVDSLNIPIEKQQLSVWMKEK